MTNRVLLGAIKKKRIPGAFLFSGNNGEKLGDAARDTAIALNCAASCGKCLNCTKIAGGLHPDLIEVMPQGKKGIIKIETVRELKNRIKFGPSEADHLTVIIHGAEKMEAPAANSLLKVLEEPPAKVLFILTTDRESGIPRTIVSRCQKIVFGGMEEETPDVMPFEAKDISEALSFSKGLFDGENRTEREEVERKFDSILGYFLGKKDGKKARIVMDATKALKKMGNARLVSDVMALRLAGVINEQ